MDKKNTIPTIYFGILLVLISTCYCDMTLEQVTKAGEMMRKVCQPKFKASDELVNGIADGKFPDEKSLKCYTNCIMEMMGSIKKGKMQYDATMKQIDIMLPNDHKEPFRMGVEACKSAAIGIKDNCEAAFALLKCFYANNPKFIFP